MQYKSSFFFNYFQFFLIDVVSASQSSNHLPNPANHPAEGACTTPMNHQSKSLSVFVSVPTSESVRGDSNPPAILTDYSGNHSISSSDATYLRD